ncbi:MAG: histidine phosphatase family protein [Brevundimonas sp.]|nr:MAG: histidine phosphatase family protein [Brevundimonas sp.]
MRRLILMRHAEAEATSRDGDRGRPLSPRGQDDARQAGLTLARLGFKPDHAVVSPARRTRQTWDLAAEALGDVELLTPDGLYNAESDILRSEIEALEDQAGCLMVVAHNPGIHALAIELLADAAASPALLERLAMGFPPGSAAIFGVDDYGRISWQGYLRPGATDLT